MSAIKGNIETVDGIRELRKNFEELVKKIESVPADETGKQMLTLLKLSMRLLEDKEEMILEERSRTSEEIKKEFKALTDVVDNLLALDEVTKK